MEGFSCAGRSSEGQSQHCRIESGAVFGSIGCDIVDSKLASYGMENPIYAIVQLAQTTMTSYLGKITLDKTFEERDVLNVNISVAGCLHLSYWVIQCLVWSLGDISPPRGVRAAMEMQAEAERKKRAQVLESEGHSYKKY
ncbi:hypothetical protein QQ045_031115 [Rhodiola kirilowii]